MQGQERNNDLPSPTRIKRGRPNNQDLDVELDNYFRTKRYMTETISKEMEDVAIAEPIITTSPSRTSTLSRCVLFSLFLAIILSPFHIALLLIAYLSLLGCSGLALQNTDFLSLRLHLLVGMCETDWQRRDRLVLE